MIECPRCEKKMEWDRSQFICPCGKCVPLGSSESQSLVSDLYNYHKEKEAFQSGRDAFVYGLSANSNPHHAPLMSFWEEGWEQEKSLQDRFCENVQLKEENKILTEKLNRCVANFNSIFGYISRGLYPYYNKTFRFGMSKTVDDIVCFLKKIVLSPEKDDYCKK